MTARIPHESLPALDRDLIKDHLALDSVHEGVDYVAEKRDPELTRTFVNHLRELADIMEAGQANIDASRAAENK